MKKAFLLICLLSMGTLAWAQTAPPLGSAESFAVLGASTVTNTGATVITGDLGVSPGTSCTGFPAPCTGGPGVVNGTIYVGAGSLAGPAQSDAAIAYGDLVAEACGTNLTGEILGTTPGAVTLSPGVYCFDSSAQLTGTLTLSGSGVYVFQMGSTLTTASDSSVVLTNGATAGDVFWQVGSSATLGTGTVFAGSILAYTSDTVTTLTETARESRAPHSRRESVSRPSSSVPAQCAADGPSSRCSRSMAAGLCGASQGAVSPPSTKPASSSTPATASGWRRTRVPTGRNRLERRKGIGTARIPRHPPPDGV